MTTDMTRFKATVLKEVGRIVESSLLEYRVLIVRDEESRIRVSAQIWWRESDTDSFNPGKGYFLNGRRSLLLAKSMRQTLTADGYDTMTMEITNTQQYIITHNVDKEELCVDKWWRKSADEEWIFGKSLAVPTDKAEELIKLLEIAGSTTINLR